MPAPPIDPLEQLKGDIERVRGSLSEQPKRTSQAGYAFRVGTELVSGVAVGCALGYGLDAWLETRPWGIFVGSILGFTAGMRLMIETSRQAGRAMEEEDRTQIGDS